MRRLVIALDGLAFLWSCAATVYVLWMSSQAGVSAPAVLPVGAGDEGRVPPSLGSAEGAWLTALLIGLTLLAGIPLGVALANPSSQRIAGWTAGLMLLGFCALSRVSVGLPYLPGTILLIAGAVVAEVASRRHNALSIP